MFQNHIKIAFRHLLKSPLFSLINLSGLAVGLAASALLGLHVLDEWQTDRFLPQPERTFRVLRVSGLKDIPYEIGITSPNYGTALQSDFEGQVEAVTRLMRGEAVVRTGEDQLFRERKTAWADSTFISFFDLKMRAGSPQTALEKPNSVVLTRKTARKYFGDETAAMGKILRVNNRTDAEVTGILEDFPAQTHFDFDLLLSMRETQAHSEYWTDWWNNCLLTYVRLSPEARAGQIEQGFPAFMDKYFARDFASMGAPIGLRLQPLREAYWGRAVRYDQIRHGSSSSVQFFAWAALLLLVTAGANYVNLATAMAAGRMREVGVQKALGAGAAQIRRQFLTESWLMALGGTIAAALLLKICMPLYTPLFGRPLQLHIPLWAWPLGAAAVVWVFGLLAGFYPALLPASLRPVDALYGQSRRGDNRSLVRRSLVVVQFGLSTALICAALTMRSQMNYLGQKDLGYERDNLLLVEADNPGVYGQRAVFEQKLKNITGIEGFSRMSGSPGSFHDALNFRIEGYEGIAKMRTSYVDHQFTETFGIRVMEGRDFSDQFASDTTEAVLLNEAAVRLMGFQNATAIGKTIREMMFDSIPKRVVGVVADYHFASLRDQIEPLVIMQASWSGNYALKLNPAVRPPSETIADVEAVWRQLAPGFPFHYEFLDETLGNLYRDEARQGRVFGLFSGLSVFIACLGMFGLAAFAAVRRAKEIGIRKVLGASVAGIARLLTLDFLKLVLIAIVIASPAAYYFMNRWLADFAYHIELQWYMFFIAGALAAVIAFLAVGGQAVKAALVNPVKSLKNE